MENSLKKDIYEFIKRKKEDGVARNELINVFVTEQKKATKGSVSSTLSALVKSGQIKNTKRAHYVACDTSWENGGSPLKIAKIELEKLSKRLNYKIGNLTMEQINEVIATRKIIEDAINKIEVESNSHKL